MRFRKEERRMNQPAKMKVTLLSFGFKHGAPDNLNYLWDVRCLPNPYWVEELRPQTGLNHEVSEYVLGSAAGRDFIKLLRPMLLYLVQQNIAMEKKEVVMAVGCTGGRHRSVAVVEVLCDILRILPLDLHCRHRDVDKDT
jgi:RNase adapter protein RapZ